jgi:hypothetical protein
MLGCQPVVGAGLAAVPEAEIVVAEAEGREEAGGGAGVAWPLLIRKPSLAPW